MIARIVQITDLHLMANPSAELKSSIPRACLQSVLNTVRSEFRSAERLIVTGDLAHDELLETYESLFELLSDWSPTLRVIPGNHDNRAFMRQIFNDQVTELDQRNVFVDKVGAWRLIGLDTQLTGEVRGQLGESQLDWLARIVASKPHQPTAIFLHHPPVNVGTGWLDEIALEDSQPFLSLLQKSPQIKLICCGHVHHETMIARDGSIVVTTPSTCVQFLPETESLVPDSVSPGFRVVDLMPDGSFRTRVVRVLIER